MIFNKSTLCKTKDYFLVHFLPAGVIDSSKSNPLTVNEDKTPSTWVENIH